MGMSPEAQQAGARSLAFWRPRRAGRARAAGGGHWRGPAGAGLGACAKARFHGRAWATTRAPACAVSLQLKRSLTAEEAEGRG